MYSSVMISLLSCSVALFIGGSFAFNPSYQYGVHSTKNRFTLSMTQIVVFMDGNIRYHDNPVLIEASKVMEPVVPVFLRSPSNGLDDEAIKDLASQLSKEGGQLYITDLQELDSVIEKVTQKSSTKVRIISQRFLDHSFAKSIQQTAAKYNVGHKQLIETFLTKQISTDLPKFNDYKSEYQGIRRSSLPVMRPNVRFSPDQDLPTVIPDSSSQAGESLALQLLREYLLLGESAFSSKYADRYVSCEGATPEHKASLQRLSHPSGRSTDLFQGEVISGLLAPLLARGCVSPRVLVHARRVLFAGGAAWAAGRPSVCRLREEAVRHDWHLSLVRTVQDRTLTDTTELDWRQSFSFWRGYVQRTARMDSSGPERKPMLLLIHGFGGSIGQYTGLARELRDEFDVHAIDSLGFGWSEKPPLSYNQYLWRDQVLEYVKGKCDERFKEEGRPVPFVVAGNSIGGFTAASLAAELRLNRDLYPSVDCRGLVMFNPSGKIVPPEALPTDDPGLARFPPFKGPASEALRLFGRSVIALLQPRIEQTCRSLYPSNPDHVTSSKLVDNILRDSCDPGAYDILAAGGKLPPPRSMNAVFRELQRPVLLSMGALDPLNNATARGELFSQLPNTTVDLLPLGHCPMDEGPVLVADSIRKWAVTHEIIEFTKKIPENASV